MYINKTKNLKKIHTESIIRVSKKEFMMKKTLSMLALIFGLSVCSYTHADIVGQYNCLTGNMSQGKILQGRVDIAKDGDHYTVFITWSDDVNKSNLDQGILNPTNNPHIFKEEWTAKSNGVNLIGMSFWNFQGQNIMVDYLYVNEQKGNVNSGEMSCSLVKP